MIAMSHKQEEKIQSYDRRRRRVQKLAYGISAALWIALMIPLVLWWNENSRANWMLVALGLASVAAPFLLGNLLEHLLGLILDAFSGVIRTPQGMRRFYKENEIDALSNSPKTDFNRRQDTDDSTKVKRRAA